MLLRLKVETHLHTLHSDGQNDVRSMFEACREAGYDAVALTDHNTLSGVEEARRAASALDLVLIEGVEVTTFHGHLVALGVTRVPEWRSADSAGMDDVIADVHAQGGVVAIAHPARLGSPVCSGCAWEWRVDPRRVDLWEIFSGPQPRFPHPDVSLALWRQHLAAGGSASPVAAGDVHSVHAARSQRAATYVLAKERSSQAVLEALRERRVFASRSASLQAGTVQTMRTPRGTCRYAEVRSADGELEAVSAPTWINSSSSGDTSV